MYHLIVFCLLLPTTSLLCMDNPPQKMVNLQLGDGSQYPIEKWKVTKESNTLCECYYSQKKSNPILVPHISAEEMILFDTALDKNISKSHSDSFSDYYDALTPAQQRTLTTACGQYGSDSKTKKLCALRLTAQLADKWLGHDIVNKAIVAQCTPEQSCLEMHLKSSMIIENIYNNLIMQSPITSYDPEDCCVIHQKNGSVLRAPKIDTLNTHNFTGKPTHRYFKVDEKKYLRLLITREKNIAVSSAEIINNSYDERVHHIWSRNPTKIIKTITHSSSSKAILSPDDKWMISFTHHPVEPSRGFILTELDPLSDQYLSDIVITPEYDFRITACFNNASSALALAAPDEIILFSLEKKDTILKLKSRPMRRSFFSKKAMFFSAELTFNHDDTRLISCFLENNRAKNCLVTIWDTSDLDNIKELQSILLGNQIDFKATTTFNYPEQDIVAISTDSATSFLNVNSGDFLAQTEAIKEQENYTYAADCSIPLTSIKCIAKNMDAKTSCINLYDCKSAKCMGSIVFNHPGIRAIGMTNDSRFLVTTFAGFKSITTQLLSDQDANAMNNMNLVDFYGLLQLYKAKKNNVPTKISLSLLNYILSSDLGKSCKNIIEKYLLSSPKTIQPELDISQSVLAFFQDLFGLEKISNNKKESLCII